MNREEVSNIILKHDFKPQSRVMLKLYDSADKIEEDCFYVKAELINIDILQNRLAFKEVGYSGVRQIDFSEIANITELCIKKISYKVIENKVTSKLLDDATNDITDEITDVMWNLEDELLGKNVEIKIESEGYETILEGQVECIKLLKVNVEDTNLSVIYGIKLVGHIPFHSSNEISSLRVI